MRRANWLIRVGLCLVPWLSALVLIDSGCAPFVPRTYRAATTLEIRTVSDDGGQAIEVPRPTSIPFSVHERICITAAYLVGYGSLIAGLVKEMRRAGLPPEVS